MASNIDIYLDAQGGGIVAGGSAAGGALPQFTRNDVYTFRLRIQDAPTGQVPVDIDTTGTSLKLGIGNIDDVPTDGQFKLTCNGTTSSAITFNSTALQIYNAISNNVSTVSTFGNEEYSYVLTATQPNTAMSFGGSSFTLFPTSSVIISTRRYPSASVQAQQVIKLRRNPAVYSDTFTASSVSGVVALSQTQVGSTTRNEIYNLAVGADAEGGSVVLSYNGNTTTAIPIGSNAASFAEALTSVTGIGANNVSVDSGNNSGDYSISFVRSLGLQALPYQLKLDASGVIYGNYLGTQITMGTAELDELFAEAGTDTITPTIEIELTQNGTPKTIYQGSISVRRDLITTGAVVPADQASYYTKAEANALFVEDLTTNVDATNRKLYNSYGTAFLDWQNNSIGTGSTILDLSGTAITISDGYNLGVGTTTGTKIGVSTASKIAFYGSTPITQPANINVVSGLINVGLIANGTTYGVFPQSPRTITTLTSVSFGTINANDQHYRDVVVTGAAVNDIVLVGLPSAISSGAIIQGVVYASNVICLSCVNADNVSRDVNTATYRISVIGY